MMNMEHTPLPWEAVPGNENHGPYITDAFGTNVCDLYVMSSPVIGESKPVLFTDAELNLPLIVEAVNSHASLVEENKRMREALERLLEHWDAGGKEKRGEFEGVEYWSPAGRMVDTEFIVAIRAALGDTNA